MFSTVTEPGILTEKYVQHILFLYTGAVTNCIWTYFATITSRNTSRIIRKAENPAEVVKITYYRSLEVHQVWTLLTKNFATPAQKRECCIKEGPFLHISCKLGASMTYRKTTEAILWLSNQAGFWQFFTLENEHFWTEIFKLLPPNEICIITRTIPWALCINLNDIWLKLVEILTIFEPWSDLHGRSHLGNCAELSNDA